MTEPYTETIDLPTPNDGTMVAHYRSESATLTVNVPRGRWIRRSPDGGPKFEVVWQVDAIDTTVIHPGQEAKWVPGRNGNWKRVI